MLDVIIVCCCCCLILSSRLAFLVMADLINLIRHFYSTEVFAWQAIFLFIRQFFEKKLEYFGGFYVPHLVDIYAKNVNEQGRNFTCNRTLLKLFVQLKSQFISFVFLLPK